MLTLVNPAEVGARVRYELVDSLRGIAALAVVFLHATIVIALVTNGITGRLAGIAFVAVPIFFVISGFVLWLPFVAASAAGNKPPGTSSFYLRRAARIFPAYWTALAAAALLITAIPLNSVVHVMTLATLTHLYSHDTAFVPLGVSWSLAVEVVFYALVPFFALAATRLSRSNAGGWLCGQLLVISVLVCVSWAYKLTVDTGWLGAAGSRGLGRAWAPAYFDMFAAGMSIAVLSTWITERRDRAARMWIRAISTQWLCWGIAAGLLLWLSTITPDADPFLPTSHGVFLARHAIHAVVSVLAVAPLVFVPHSTTPLRRVLALRPMRFAGRVSYGVYLWHSVILYSAFKGGLRPPGGMNAVLFWTVFGCATALLAGYVSWVLVERPLIRWSGGRTRTRGSGPAAAT